MQVDSQVYLVDIGGVVVSCATGWTSNRETDVEAPPPCKGSAISAWEQPARGAKRKTGTLTGVVDFTSAYGVAQLKAAHDNNTDITVIEGTGVTGEPRETTTFIVQSVSDDASGVSKMTYDANLVAVGAPVIDVFP